MFGIAARQGSLVIRSRHNVDVGRRILPRCFASDSRSDKPLRLWYPILGGLVITIGGGVKWWHDHVYVRV
jgi:hypothetical protein